MRNSLRLIVLARQYTQLAKGSRRSAPLFRRPFIINRIGVKLPNPCQAQDISRQLETRFGYRIRTGRSMLDSCIVDIARSPRAGAPAARKQL